MAKERKIQSLLDIIRDIVQNKCQQGYTGTLTISIIFNQGGIRSCEQLTKDVICINTDS